MKLPIKVDTKTALRKNPEGCFLIGAIVVTGKE